MSREKPKPGEVWRMSGREKPKPGEAWRMSGCYSGYPYVRFPHLEGAIVRILDHKQLKVKLPNSWCSLVQPLVTPTAWQDTTPQTYHKDWFLERVDPGIAALYGVDQ